MALVEPRRADGRPHARFVGVIVIDRSIDRPTWDSPTPTLNYQPRQSTGARTEEAPEARECAQALDAVQDGRHLRAAPLHGPAQAARVAAAHPHPAQPPEVRADQGGGQRHLQAEVRQGGRQGPLRRELPRRLHGCVLEWWMDDGLGWVDWIDRGHRPYPRWSNQHRTPTQQTS